MKVGIFAPSYRRANRLETPAYIPAVRVVVGAEEEEEYREWNPLVNFEVAPRGIQGNIARVRNWILDEFQDRYDCVVMVDDDLRQIGYWEEKGRVSLKGKGVLPFCRKYSELAKGLGVYFWGMNCNEDMQGYREQTPFSLTVYIGAPFQGFLKGNELRYDERLPLKEDYDMSLQQLNRYRKVLRVNKFHYVVRQVEQEGGCAEMRSLDFEKEQMALLVRKWGDRIVHQSDRVHIAKKGYKKGYHINPIIKPPIKGV